MMSRPTIAECEGFRWVVEDSRNGSDACVDKAFHAGLGLVEGHELLETIQLTGHY
jgi:hypothetical protein